jgi:hypothetical protein
MSADGVHHASTTTARAMREAKGYAPAVARLPSRLRHIGRTADLPALFPCFVLCMECGYLQHPPREDSYRAVGAPAPAHPCPSCGVNMWLDLQRTEAVRLLAERDDAAASRRQSARRRWSRWAARATGTLALGGGFVVVGVFLLYEFLRIGSLIPALFTAMGLCIAPFVLWNKAADRLALPMSRPRPARWHFPLPSLPPAVLPVDAQVMPASEPVAAPLSGRPCIAYEIGIRDDDDPRAPQGTWLLLEQHVVPLQVGSHAIAADSVFLDVADRRMLAPNDEESCERRRRVLRERGISRHSSVIVYETIVPPEASLRLSVREDAWVLQAEALPIANT